MYGGNMSFVPPEEREWTELPSSARQSLEEQVDCLPDGNYSGGEADGEMDNAVRAPRTPIHRRSVSNSVVEDEQAWRSQSPTRRLSHTRPSVKAPAARAGAPPTGKGLVARSGFGPNADISPPEPELQEAKQRKRSFFRRKSKVKETEPVPVAVDRIRSASLKQGSRWLMGLGPASSKSPPEASEAPSATLAVQPSGRAGAAADDRMGGKPAAARGSFEGTEGSSTGSMESQYEQAAQSDSNIRYPGVSQQQEAAASSKPTSIAEREAARQAYKQMEADKHKDRGSKSVHRRQSSLNSLLSLVGRGKSMDEEDGVQASEPSPPHTPRSSAAHQASNGLHTTVVPSAASQSAKVHPAARPKTPEIQAMPTAAQKASAGTMMSCFGLGGNTRQVVKGAPAGAEVSAGHADESDAAEVIIAPGFRQITPGMVGLRNLGNTCFMNAALQCLRFTPGLAERLVVHILEELPSPGSPAYVAVTTEHPPLQMPPPPPEVINSDGTSPARPASASSSVQRTPLGGGVVVQEESLLSSLSISPSQAASASASGHPSPRDTSRPESSAPSPRNTHEQGTHPGKSLTDLMQQPLTPASHAQAEAHAQAAVHHAQYGSESSPAYAPAADHVRAPAGSSEGLSLDDPSSTLPHSQQGASSVHTSPARSQQDCAVNGDASPSSTATLETGEGSGNKEGSGGATIRNSSAAQPDGNLQGAKGVTAAPLKEVAAAVQQQALVKGQMSDAFREVLKDTFLGRAGSVADPTPMLQRLSQVPLANEFFDGGQHDCQEVLRTLMNALHDDMKHVPKKRRHSLSTDDAEAANNGDTQQEPDKGTKGKDKEQMARAERAKADRLWEEYLRADSSPITEMFGGQLQSSIVCSKCSGRFTTYEPFWDLSLPLVKEKQAGSGIGGWLSNKTVPPSIGDCLAAFAADEVLQGEERFSCEVCKEHTTATKRMRIHRLPRCLLLHIKRFRYIGMTREKLTSPVTYPLKGLKLSSHMSEDAAAAAMPDDTNYELYAVSNHFGNLVGGHYTTFCRANTETPGKHQWLQLNDEVVLRVLQKEQIVSQNAYMLFYVRKDS